MIQIEVAQLPVPASTELHAYQAGVDAKPDFASRVTEADKAFKYRNQPGKPTFDQVKATLTAMCAGARRCMYCEDSVADEVEHHHPKSLYPERVFLWENYLYACGPCNGPKNNKFAVFLATDRSIHRIPRPAKGTSPHPPPGGDPVLIDPRTEAPMEFLMLDFLTFRFVGIDSAGRGDYALEVLGLNDRTYLLKARRIQYQAYKSLLADYTAERDRGAPAAELDLKKAAIQSLPHPTVWHEMKRQHQSIPELLALFTAAPEALGW